MNGVKTALAIAPTRGQTAFAEHQDELWESSSTIKIPIMILAVTKLTRDGTSLDKQLIRQPHHTTKGSGILNWTNLASISFRDLIHTILVYSDCLATNMLIEFVGGQAAINQWLESEGFKTRLLMPYLIFSDEEVEMPVVGQTTASEMLELYRLLDNLDCPSEIRQLIDSSSAQVNESWLELSLPAKLDGLKHKTGSMIDCGPAGDTVFNAAGSFNYHDQKYYFCILSAGQLRQNSKQIEPRQMSRSVAAYLSQSIKDYC